MVGCFKRVQIYYLQLIKYLSNVTKSLTLQVFVESLKVKLDFCCVNRIISLLIYYSFLVFNQTFAQTNILGFYNVENLFDTEDDPLINDAEFLPTGANQWTTERYFIKLQNMSSVLKGVNADVIGLAEVENRKVLEDLVQHPNLIAKRYQIIHFDMDDGRGIDVAMLYKPNVFKPFKIVKLPIQDPNEPRFKTRDILWVKGLFQGDTLHFIVNHWPSRSGGGKEDKRLLAAQVLRRAIDSVMVINPNSKMVMVGDFNDDPNNKSIKKILCAENEKREEILVNASEPTFKKGYGTLYYNGIWNLFDQIIISKNLEQGVQHYVPSSFTVYVTPEMLEKEGRYAGAPRRTFRSGQFDENGFSDHLPVYIKITKQ